MLFRAYLSKSWRISTAAVGLPWWLIVFGISGAAERLDPRVGPRVIIGSDPVTLPAANRAQAEPHIARSPLNSDVLLATFQEGRFTDGGAVTCGYAHSTNGGLTWIRALIPQLTQVNGGAFDRATDPVAAFDAAGNAYLCTLGLSGPDNELGVLLLNRSTDGGATFGPPREIFRPSSTALFPDKNWFAINQLTSAPFAGRIAVTFTRFGGSGNPLAITTSDDQGASWSLPRIFTPTSGSFQGTQPLWLPDGSLVIVYWNFRNPRLLNDDAIECVRSTDGGRTFGPPVNIRINFRMFDASLVRDGAFLPSATCARNSGELFVAYQAYDFLSLPRIFVQRSADRGVTWSAPLPISDNPSTGEVFNPAIDVSPDGRRVVVAFFDSRTSKLPFVDTFAAESFDGGRTWKPNLRLSERSTDVRLAPLTGTGYMLGDYIGVVAPVDEDTPAVAMSMVEQAGGIDPLAIRWGVAEGLTFESWRAARWSRADVMNPAIATAESDADLDGFSLRSEYVSGLDPLALDLGNATALKVERVGPVQVALSFAVRPGMADYRYQLERQLAGGPEWLLLATPEITSTLEDQATVRLIIPATETVELFRYRFSAPP